MEDFGKTYLTVVGNRISIWGYKIKHTGHIALCKFYLMRFLEGHTENLCNIIEQVRTTRRLNIYSILSSFSCLGGWMTMML